MLKSINTFEDLINTAWNFRISKILFSAIELNLFNLLSDSPEKAETIIEKLNLNPLAGEFFLNSLAALGLLQKENNRYKNSEIAEKFLVEKSSSYRGEILKHFHNGWDNWAKLEEVLQKKTGQKEDSSWRNFILGMCDLGCDRAKKIADLIDMSDIKSMLDLGGGPGIYAVTFAKKYPNLKATIFDLPETIKITKEIIKKHTIENQVLTKEGDFIRDKIGKGYDMILASNIIHSYGPETNQMLINKTFESLNKNGMILINDFIMDEDKTNPCHAVLFGLHMIVNTDEGRTYTFEELKNMLEKAGFKGIKSMPLDKNSRLIIGKK